MRKRVFVYSVCGDAHVEYVNVSLRFLKSFSRAEILVVTARSERAVQHDQVLRASVPKGLTDHQASIFMKTGLPSLAGGAGTTCCYLDSDQIAVSPDVDTVFSHYRPPMTFVRDHINVQRFSRHAVNCGCRSPQCHHLAAAIFQKFGVAVRDPEWRHWNGGLFLFDQDSIDFALRWHEYSLLAFQDPYWRTRDQGTLVAAAWGLGLQHHTTLPPRFNRIVDRFRGHPEASRPHLPVQSYSVDTGYNLGGEGAGSGPAFLHFINHGMCRKGWKNWDDAELLLDGRRRLAATIAARRRRPGSADG